MVARQRTDTDCPGKSSLREMRSLFAVGHGLPGKNPRSVKCDLSSQSDTNCPAKITKIIAP